MLQVPDTPTTPAASSAAGAALAAAAAAGSASGSVTGSAAGGSTAGGLAAGPSVVDMAFYQVSQQLHLIRYQLHQVVLASAVIPGWCALHVQASA
jgi:hypothetical protein